MEISKLAVLLANEHQSNCKKCYKRFSYKFPLCIRSRKNDSVNGMPENVSSRRIITKMAAQYFIEYGAISKKFAGINHQYMDILYHTKKQTENIPSSCCYLLLKTLFYLISQCTSVPYLESGLCKWTTAILRLFSQETDLLMKVIMKCVNIKLEDLKVLRHSPDLLNNGKIGQGQLQLIMDQILFYYIWGLQPFWSSDLNNLMNNPSNSPEISEKKMFR